MAVTDRPAPTQRGDRTSRRARRLAPWRFTAGSWVLIGVFMLGLLYPVFKILSTLFWSGGSLNLSAFRQFASEPGVGGAILNTTIVVAVSSALGIAVGGLLAWLNERTDARMGALTDMLPFMPFLCPPFATAIGWVFLLAPSAGYVNTAIVNVLNALGAHLHSGPFNIYSFPGLIFVYTLHAIPYAFLMISAGLRNLDSQLEEQSRVCGSGHWRTLARVVAPAMAPSIAGAFLLTIWTGYSAYSTPQAIAQPAGIQIMSVKLVEFLNFDFPPKLGPASVLSLIMVGFVAIAWYAQSRILRRSTYSTVGGRGGRGSRVALGPLRTPVRIVIVAFMALVTLLPILANLLVALSGYWTTHLVWARMSFSAFSQALAHDASSVLAVRDSIVLGLIASTLAIAVAAFISVFFSQSRSGLTRRADGALKLPVVLSHVVLAIGFIMAYAGRPLNLGGTLTILFIAYLLVYMPQGTLATDPAAAQVGAALNEASQVAGAGRWRTFRKVYVPLMIPGIVVGWTLLFVRIVGDLEISQLLAGTNTPTISSQMFLLYSKANYSEVAALSIILTIITSLLVVAAFVLSRRLNRSMLPAVSPVMR